jgi:hypothetical protein
MSYHSVVIVFDKKKEDDGVLVSSEVYLDNNDDPTPWDSGFCQNLEEITQAAAEYFKVPKGIIRTENNYTD